MVRKPKCVVVLPLGPPGVVELGLELVGANVSAFTGDDGSLVVCALRVRVKRRVARDRAKAVRSPRGKACICFVEPIKCSRVVGILELSAPRRNARPTNGPVGRYDTQ